MKILLIGSGGREHALAWKLSQSELVTNIYAAPGNAGTEMTNKCCNVQLYTHDELLSFAKDNEIDLTIVGPENPLVAGIVDLFKQNKLCIFGPSQAAAKLEGSKIYAKNFMNEFGVKTADYKTFTHAYAAVTYLRTAKYPLVIKANGLAAGKGVEICNNFKDAEATINSFMVDGIFKDAGKTIVVEEFLSGVEASIICVTDGKTIVPLISAQDHKTINENNKGPNTGGMGAVCPNVNVNKKTMTDFTENIMLPTLKGIQKTKLDYHGFIFFGVMITKDGCKCLEYNVRMGDPECQSILPLMNFDLVKLCQATVTNNLSKFKLKWKRGACVNVVLTSAGYPGNFKKGYKITVKGKPLIFFAGANIQNNVIVTTGGRVLSVVAVDKNNQLARKKVYQDVAKVYFDHVYYRKDIGL
ncbi:MAG: phosphoribosylamine--glycine ligase [Mycoplasmataceae bacterium]|nr:phosphoribosylamine--glycine ligase [Mycoplasmataceae bacterium]